MMIIRVCDVLVNHLRVMDGERGSRMDGRSAKEVVVEVQDTLQGPHAEYRPIPRDSASKQEEGRTSVKF